MTKVTFLNAKAPDFSYLENPELERRILTFRRHMAEQHIDDVLAERRRRVRAARWARRGAVAVNWAGLIGGVLMLASAFVTTVAALALAALLGYRP